MIVSIWKPVGPSSHAIIYQLRKITKIKRIGHAGTLDPLASGVLIVGITRESTRQLAQFMQQDKEYQAVLHLGQTSTTDDAEGEKTLINVTSPPSQKRVEHIVKQFIGNIEQTPPAFSAIKIHGKKSYQLARKGKSVKLTPRPITIYSIVIEKYEYPDLVLTIRCGKGTYIRSLARDIGQALTTGAYISSLTRTRVGNFTKQNSLTIDEFRQQWETMRVNF